MSKIKIIKLVVLLVLFTIAAVTHIAVWCTGNSTLINTIAAIDCVWEALVIGALALINWDDYFNKDDEGR